MRDDVARNKIHKAIAGRFIGFDEYIDFFGKEVRIPKSTKLSKDRFSKFIKSIILWSNSELGIILPDPEDTNWDNFKQKYETYLDWL
jgi:hypothetical protein